MQQNTGEGTAESYLWSNKLLVFSYLVTISVAEKIAVLRVTHPAFDTLLTFVIGELTAPEVAGTNAAPSAQLAWVSDTRPAKQLAGSMS
jgi:hypothetical protein